MLKRSKRQKKKTNKFDKIGKNKFIYISFIKQFFFILRQLFLALLFILSYFLRRVLGNK